MPMIQEGTWAVDVAGTFLGKSKTGTGYVAVTFRDEVGDTITAYLYTSDKAIERTVETLEVLGWDVQRNNGDLLTLHETQTLVGAKAEIVVEAETYEGKTRNKVKWINAPGGGGRAEGMAADEAKAFAAQLRAKVFGSKAGKPAAPKPASKPAPRQTVKQAAPAPSDDDAIPTDDIPF